MVVALIALFVALGGTAGAVSYAIPALAKRALVADNAKKLNGKTLNQVVAQASPASTAARLVSAKTSSLSLAVEQGGYFPVACDAGKVISGGYTSDVNSVVVAFDTYALDERTWQIYLANAGTTVASVTLYALCIT